MIPLFPGHTVPVADSCTVDGSGNRIDTTKFFDIAQKKCRRCSDVAQGSVATSGQQGCDCPAHLLRCDAGKPCMGDNLTTTAWTEPFRCVQCPNGTAISSDRSRCVSCPGDVHQRTGECICPDPMSSIAMDVSRQGSLLDLKECVTCASGIADGRCIQCPEFTLYDVETGRCECLPDYTATNDAGCLSLSELQVVEIFGASAESQQVIYRAIEKEGRLGQNNGFGNRLGLEVGDEVVEVMDPNPTVQS